MTLTKEQKEDLRHAALAALAVRAPAALSVRQLARAVKQDVAFLFEESDLQAALTLLAGFTPPLVTSAVDELGASTYWSASTAGVLYVERGK